MRDIGKTQSSELAGQPILGGLPASPIQEQDGGTSADRAGTRGSQDRVIRRYLVRNVLYSPEHRLIFFATPKAASTTMKATLLRLNLGLDCPPPDRVHDLRYTPQTLPELPADELLEWMNLPSIRRFCFVRNPYTRLLSCYLDKIKGRRKEPGAHIARFRSSLSETGSTSEISFEKFIDSVSRQSPAEMNRHWRVQTVHLCWDQISYNFVGQVERFDSELDRLSEFIGVDLRPYLDVRNRHQTEANEAVDGYYTSQLRERVYKIYEADFKVFGYSR